MKKYFPIKNHMFPSAIFVLMISGAAIAETENGIGAVFAWSHDNEGFNTQRIGLEYLPRHENLSSTMGIRATHHHYTQNGWRQDGQQIALIARQRDPATYNGWDLNAGVFHQGQHNLLTLDGAYRLPVTSSTGLEIFINRDWVETQRSLERGIHFTYWGASVDQQLGQHLTVVGLVGQQAFSDSNSRLHGRFKLIYQPWLDSGLTLQLRHRRYHSNADNVEGNYFNPKKYDESMLAAGWRKQYQGWRTSLTIGMGIQHVNDDPSTHTRLLEASIESPIRSAQSIKISGGHNQSASYNGPNYRHSYIQGEWIIRF